MEESKKVKISQIKSNTGKLSPILVDFEHGQVDPEAFKNFQAKIKIGLPENQAKENEENSPQLKLEIKSDHMTYSSTAKSLNGYGIRHDPYYSTYIGIRNKEDGTMKLYEIEQMTVAAKVKPPETSNRVLIQAKMAKMEEDRNEVDSGKKAKEAAAKKHLVQEFGQSKGRRIYAQADRMAVEAENMTEKLSRAAENVSQEAIAMPNQVMEQVNLAPPCNKNAANIRDIYKITDILSNVELESLSSAAEALSQQFDTKDKISEGQKNKKFTELFAYMLNQNLDKPDDEKYEKIGIALYMEGIVKFLNMRAPEFSKGARGLPELIPMSIRHKIFHFFTDEQRISPESKDRSVCYVLVLALIISPFFVLDLSVLTSSLKSVKVPQIKKLINVIGAHLKTDADKRAYIQLTQKLSTFDPNKIVRKRKL